MSTMLTPAIAPELVFGLVAPIGVDLDLVTEVIEHTLTEVGYTAHRFRLTELMRELPVSVELKAEPYIESYRTRIAFANEVRRSLGNDALATLAISAIRSFRATQWRQRQDDSPQPDSEAADAAPFDESDREEPLTNQAYILRQLKRPEEISLLRGVYGKQFILVSVYSPSDMREQRIKDLEIRSRGGLISDIDAEMLARTLVAQDSDEATDEFGQSVRDAFPLGDVFIDASSRNACEQTVRRFILLLFGNNSITPTHDEYGMYLAKTASLRSSDLSRQVGAAVFCPTGEVATLGCNEVPKAGGGTYWGGEPIDHRDFVEGHDPNERKKN